MEKSTKCFSIEDKGPMCPRRGRDGRVGPPGAKTVAVVITTLQGFIDLIIEPWKVSGWGGW